MGRRLLGLLALFAAPALVLAQAREATIVLKDGFAVKGKPIQKKDVLIDPATGASFIIPKDGSFLYLDDDVRKIYFSPYQVQEVVPTKPGQARTDLIQIVKQKPPVSGRSQIPRSWNFRDIGPWNDHWERTFTVDTGNGTRELTQRIIKLTPWQSYFMMVGYIHDQQFLTKELGPEFVMGLLTKYYGGKQDMKEVDRRLKIAQFLNEAGWYGNALVELEKLVKEHPEAKTNADPLIDQLKKLRATMFGDDIERAHRVGQHEEAQKRIAMYLNEKMGALAGEKQEVIVQDIKAQYETGMQKLAEAKKFLKDLPTKVKAEDRPFWTIAAATISEELTIDNWSRLETFLNFAQQYARAVEEKSRRAQPAEEVLSIGVSGWLQGNALAEPDVKNAAKLFKARLMLQEYLKTDDKPARDKMAASFSRENDLPVDVIARVIRQMPPVTPYDKVSQDQLKIEIDSPDTSGGSYLVQLPPDYSHYRAYPVVLMLQSPREAATTMVQRWRELAAYHGYILAAPLWGGKGKSFSYKYSAGEHSLVLDCLRDLRRRFNVDSDRVFLFGWEDGGTMAFDVGLSHPEHFAGVLPMNGDCGTFPLKYWSNAQYLPFYVIDGEYVGIHRKQNEELRKKWNHYPYLFIEYKGRASEWYGWEIPTMFEWMDKKQRRYPARDLGTYHTAGGDGEEFKTLRQTDNKFYWLGAGKIDDKNLADSGNFDTKTRPASLQANIAVGNEADSKGAKIWNQISIRSSGAKRISVWLAPNMIDFTKPVQLRHNGALVGNPTIIQPNLSTMLEHFYEWGDRQRLFYAKVDLK